MRISRLVVLLVWLIFLNKKIYAQYFYYRDTPDAGLIVGYDFSRLNLTSHYDRFQKRNGTAIPYVHFGAYLNIPWSNDIVISTEFMYARYGLNYHYRPDMYNLPPGINYDLNKERIEYLINNWWVRTMCGQFAIQAGLKFSYLLHSSGTQRNLYWSASHDDLYQKFNVRIILGAEYAIFNGKVTPYFHTRLPAFPLNNILSEEAADVAFPNSSEMRLFELQIGTKLRIGR